MEKFSENFKTSKKFGVSRQILEKIAAKYYFITRKFTV